MENEWKLYNFLYENLAAEHKRDFLTYVELRGLRESEEIKAANEYGFKTAICLIIDSLKE